MSYYALWIDHHHAYVYKFNADGVEEMKMESEFKNHENQNHEKEEKFYHQVADKLGQAKELMIMGPGTAKDQFKHHCEKHHHKNLFSSIVGSETMQSHPTKAMMLQKASTFFKSYHQWTKNY